METATKQNVHFENIPDDLAELDHWILWTFEEKRNKNNEIDIDENGEIQYTKIPKQPNGINADSTQPNTWSDLETVEEALNKNPEQFDGIGFVFTNSGIVGIDIDNKNEELQEYLSSDDTDINTNAVAEFIETTKSYAEVSPSGNGIHIYMKGSKPEGKSKTGNFEMYDTKRFFTVTGNRISERKQLADDEELNVLPYLHNKYIARGDKHTSNVNVQQVIENAGNGLSDEEIIQKIIGSKQREKFMKLFTHGDISSFPSQSDADYALISILRWWTNNDVKKIDRIFRKSALMRDKWDRPTGSSTYGMNSIIQNITESNGDGYKAPSKKYDFQMNDNKNVLSLDSISNMEVFTDDYVETDERNEAIEALIEETLSHDITESNQLKQLLTIRGFLERKKIEHFKNVKDPELKKPRISEFKTSVILREYVPFVVISEKRNPVSMYLYDEGIYTSEPSYIHEVISWLENIFTEPQSNQVIFHIKKYIDVVEKYNGGRFSCIGNGIMDWKEKKLLPYKPSLVFTAKADVNYKEFDNEPEIDGWKFSDAVAEWAGHDKEVEFLLWQVLRASLQIKNREQFVLLIDDGIGRTGKGTFQQFIQSLVGIKNIATLTMAEFGKAHQLEGIEEAQVIIGDDNDEKSFLAEPKFLKSIATGDPVTINPKGTKKYTFQGTPLIIQSSNGYLKTSDITSAFKRRMLFVPFMTKFDRKKGNTKVKSEYAYDPEILSWILYQSVQMEDFTLFTQPGVTKELLHEFELQNDPVADFFYSIFDELDSGRVKKRFVYELFIKWCEEVGRTTNLSERQFSRRFTKFIDESENWKVSSSTLAISYYFVETDSFINDRRMLHFNDIDINKYRGDRKPCYVNPANEKQIDVQEIDKVLANLKTELNRLETTHSNYKSMDIDETRNKIIDLEERRKELMAS